MNIKRMADQYSDRVKDTGANLADDIGEMELSEGKVCKIHISKLRTDIKRWYNHLHRALGSEKDLKKLLNVWECLIKISKICEGTDEVLRQRLLFEIRNEMGDFIHKLPRLIEKSLTRSVRESGIRLR